MPAQGVYRRRPQRIQRQRPTLSTHATVNSFTRNVTDSLVLNGALTRGNLAPVRAITESLVLGDAPSRTTGNIRSVSDALALGTGGLPAFRAAGTPVFNANTVVDPTVLSPLKDGTTAIGDLMVLATYSRSNTATVATPTGWALHPDFPVRHGTTGGGSWYVFLRPADGTADDAPTISWSGVTTGTTGTSSSAHILSFSNATATPDGTATFTATTSGATITVPSMTTSADKSLWIALVGRAQDIAMTFTISAPLTEASDVNTLNAAGHGAESSYAVQSPAGATGTATCTPSVTTSVLTTAVSFALRAGAAGETLTRTVSLPRPLTDSAGLSNALARSNISYIRALTEALVLNGALARGGVAQVRTLTESLVLADSIASVRGKTRAITESLALANALARGNLSFVRALTEALVLTDALTRGGVTQTRTITDSLALADVIASIRGKTRAITDALALANVLTRGNLAIVRALTEALVLTDVLTRGAAVHARTLTESLTLADSVATVRGKTRPITDSLALANVLTRGSTAHPRTLTESLALANVLTRGVAFHPRLITDAIVLSDSLVAFVGGAVPDETLPTFVTIINTISQTVVVVPVVATAQVNNPPQQTVVVTPVTATVAVP